MRQVFISYARDDRRSVEALADRLERMVDAVWFDTQLHGGEDWWAGILERIRASSTFLAVVSRASLNSEACRIEREYATSVNRPVVPVALEALPPVLPREIAARQIVDFSVPGEKAVADLARALLASPDPEPLPDPLPPDPEAPLSYLTDLVDLVDSPRELTKSEQMEIIFQLERGLESSDHDEREGARHVLRRMTARDDLASSVEKTINLLAREHVPQVRAAQADSEAPPSGPTSDPRARRETTTRSPSAPSVPRPPGRVPASETSKGISWGAPTGLLAVLGTVAVVGALLALAANWALGRALAAGSEINEDWLWDVRAGYEQFPTEIENLLWLVALILLIYAGFAVARGLRTSSPLAAAAVTLAAAVRALPVVVLCGAAAVILEEDRFVGYGVTAVIATTVGVVAGALWEASQTDGSRPVTSPGHREHP